MDKSKRGIRRRGRDEQPGITFVAKSVIHGIIREAPLDDNFTEDVRGALGQRVDEL